MKFHKRTISDVPIRNKTVLVRVGYDVPLTADGEVSDDLRVQASLPTIDYLRAHNCKIVLIAHLGRPEGEDPSFSLAPVARKLEQLIGEPVRFIDKAIGDKVRLAIKRAPSKDIIMLENLRFYEGEKHNDKSFAHALVRDSGAKYFVQDAFSNAHRSDASMAAITQFIPSVAGLQLEKEVTSISDAIKKPRRPLVAILGGAKVSDKIGVIERFVNVADRIVIGGAMANTFLAYKGYDVGKSKVETDQLDTVKQIYEAVAQKVGEGKEDSFLLLPEDLAVVAKIGDNEPRRVVDVKNVAPNDICIDIGDKTIQSYIRLIHQAHTVIWNGTMGYAEVPQFAHGSARVALELATNKNITSIIGGGDTADFVRHWDGLHGGSFSHVSTGGGASLELMAGNLLPGVEYLLDA